MPREAEEIWQEIRNQLESADSRHNDDAAIRETIAQLAAEDPALERVMNHLKMVMTPSGILSWFRRPRSELNGRAPEDVLTDRSALQRLEELAAQARSSNAS
jgi:hypothetical protein